MTSVRILLDWYSSCWALREAASLMLALVSPLKLLPMPSVMLMFSISIPPTALAISRRMASAWSLVRV